MAEKSNIMTLPILDANEAKYEDCDHILRLYEKWIAEIYVKVGLVEEIPQVKTSSTRATRYHREVTPDGPIREMSLNSFKARLISSQRNQQLHPPRHLSWRGAPYVGRVYYVMP